MKPYVVPGTLLCAALCCSCSPSLGDMAVRVDLPAFPAAWSGAEAWELSWVSAAGSGGPFRVMPGTAAELDLPRGYEAAVLCRAVFDGGLSLPYGAPWPQWLTEDGVLRPSAAGGFAASFAATFYAAGCGACGFDLRRLAVEAEARLSDPWDVVPIVLGLIASEGSFRVDYLRAPELFPVEILGLPSALYPDSPWNEPVVPDALGAAVVAVARGRVRRWIGGGYELRVGVSPSGVAAWTLSSAESARSGIVIEKMLPKPSLLSAEASPP